MKLNLHLQKNDLIPVFTTDQGNQVVDGRQLHSFLGIGKDYSTWAKGIIKKHGLIENKHYVVLKPEEIISNEFSPKLGKKEKRGRSPKEYIFRLDPAKKIAMGTNNEAGEKVKEYFLACERIAKGNINPVKSLGDHAQKEIQIFNSKESAAITFRQGGLEDTKDYFKKTCLMASGMTTTEVKNMGKRNGLKTKDTNSARACLRKINPPAAATLSFIDTAYRAGVSLAKVEPLANKVKEVFKDMLNLGLTPGELAA